MKSLLFQKTDRRRCQGSEYTRGVVRRAVHASIALGVRQVFVTTISFLGGILLARLLSPAEFGVYGIVCFLLPFLSTFAHAGLAVSLVRQADEPGEEDYEAVFSFQLVTVVPIVSIAWLAAPSIAKVYQLSPNDDWVFRLVALSLLFMSFQTIPAAGLERRMSFHKLAVVDVAVALVFFGSAVGLAWEGAGVFAFGAAMLARALTGAFVSNLVSPWRIRWRWDWARVRKHLRFGFTYQGTALVSVLKDSVTPVFVGVLLGASAVGYINWASMVAFYPVLALVFMQRMYLPAFAQLQQERELLGRFVEQILRAANGFAAPIAVLTLVCIVPLTKFVFGVKWLVALPLFYLFWTADVFAPTTAPLLALLNALGDSQTPFNFALGWMLLTWVLGVPLTLVFGTAGLALAYVLVGFTHLMLYRIVQARVNFRIATTVMPSWCVAAVIGAATFCIIHIVPPGGLAQLGTYAVLALCTYALIMYWVHRTEVGRVWALIWGEA